MIVTPPAALNSTVMSEATATGSTLSSTVTVTDSEVALPPASVAVKVIVLVPRSSQSNEV